MKDQGRIAKAAFLLASPVVPAPSYAAMSNDAQDSHHTDATALPASPPDPVADLIGGTNADPFGVLGPHWEQPAGCFVVRVFRPGAVKVEILPDGGDPVHADCIDSNGVFAAHLHGAGSDPANPPRYRTRFHFVNGHELETRDPYSFGPILGEQDAWFFGQGQHLELDRILGSHVETREGVDGTRFAVWAPNARRVSVVGDFNRWDGRVHPMRRRLECGVWELFIPGLGDGEHYKYEVIQADGRLCLKTDPVAFQAQHGPDTAAITWTSRHQWNDDAWMASRAQSDPLRRPVSIYEVHPDSWARVPEEGNRRLTYRELADRLLHHVQTMGFTHVELLPVTEFPYDGSWGYQVTGYFAPTSRFGSPDDFKYFVDEAHRRGIGVILDWVPAHFPKDDHGLARFDGTALYEHADPRQGEHLDWGTLIFNFGRNEVNNFLLSSALHWLREYHIDGLRVDAVASMLYLDYSRNEGEWIPNEYGGRENIPAIEFLRKLNHFCHTMNPGALMIAEESTAWGGVSKPPETGGLGFTFKWNMGWMNDTLAYMERDPIHRRFHHNEATFSLIYAFHENFMLVLSHDEVVHGKRSLLNKMPGDRWQKFANLRLLYGWMFAHPGKKLLFQGAEIGAWDEWDHRKSVDWHLLLGEEHEGLRRLVRDLNHIYQHEPALHATDHDPEGFRWLDHSDWENSVFAFQRTAPNAAPLAVVINATPVVRPDYRIGLPHGGVWREILNTDAREYAGSGVTNPWEIHPEPTPWQGHDVSALLTLPPLGTLILRG